MLQLSSNQQQMLDLSSGWLKVILPVLTRPKKSAYWQTILMNSAKGSTLRQTIGTK
jgi:hypothetical protein